MKRFKELNAIMQLNLDSMKDSATVECLTVPFEFKKLIQYFHSSPIFPVPIFLFFLLSPRVSVL